MNYLNSVCDSNYVSIIKYLNINIIFNDIKSICLKMNRDNINIQLLLFKLGYIELLI